MSDNKKVITLGVASVAALGAAYVASSFLFSKPKPVVKKVDTVQVLTVTRNVDMGSEIKPEMVAWKKWPKSMLLPGMIIRRNNPDFMSRIKDARAQVPLVAGEPILRSKITPDGNGGMLSLVLKPGMRAIAVKVRVATTAGGFIQAKDRVDLYLVRRIKKQAVADKVMENVRVLAMGSTSILDKKTKKKRKIARTATLEVTPEQAEVLAKVQAMGTIVLALRPAKEGSEDDMPRLTPKYARTGGGTIRVIRYGKTLLQPVYGK